MVFWIRVRKLSLCDLPAHIQGKPALALSVFYLAMIINVWINLVSTILHREFYYIAHINNLESILDIGIYSHKKIENEGIIHTSVYDKEIVRNRSEIKTPDGKILWDFANLYFVARNPMLYRVIHEVGIENTAILSIKKSILDIKDIYVTDGNAASGSTNIYPIDKIDTVYGKIKAYLRRIFWHEIDDSKRIIMAEILVPDSIEPPYIDSIFVANHEIREKLLKKIHTEKPIIVEPKMFFQPTESNQITPKLAVVDGDMFFSDLQTITVSVNCVGVMGKGIASRAKYQFPEVFVYYNDLCRAKKLKYGKPAIYKRSRSFDTIYADHPESLSNSINEKWFLLFPTKDHWRNDSSIEGIEAGLKWLVKNYKDIGIKSLAIPALGCGLGNLDWADVGPLMCKYLSQLDIEVKIYLPLEKQIPKYQKTKEFLCPNAPI